MPKIHIIIEDKVDGSVGVRCVSDRLIPPDVADWSAAELFAKQTAEAIDILYRELNKENETTISES